MNKTSPIELAIFGGQPTFPEKLHVGRPNVGERDHFLSRVNNILDCHWFTNNGPYVQEFEKRLAEFLGVRHCMAITNATVGLEIVTRAAELKGEVIIPSFTFVATAHALQWQEITPVFCDVAPRTHNIDPAQIEKMITPRTTAIIGVHVWGHPCEIDVLQKIADAHGLYLIFDAAHALGCTYKGKMIGGFGNAEVFSFHATKFVNAFEGGAITTNDDELARRIRFMRNFGFAGYDQVDYVGTNGKMTEVCAAMGLTSLESIDSFIETNFCNYQHYQRELSGIPGISLFNYSESERSNYQYIILEIDEAVTGISRDDLIKILQAENVLARRYFYPGCHQMEPYRSYFPHAGLLLANTEQLTNRVMSMPTGTAVSEEAIRDICQIIRFAIQNSATVRLHMEQLGL